MPNLPAGLPAVEDARPLSGGMVANVWRARLADGRTVVVKATDYDAGLEADGLQALGDAGAPVPEVVACDTDVLVMTLVSGTPDWAGLGETLAGVHDRTAERFGWHCDNVIGPLPQANPWTDDWASFYVEHRIRPHLDHPALPPEIRRRLTAAAEGPLPALLDHGPSPSLVHGDLWSGNVVDGSYLIDPAVHYADREFELAFMDLFGGFPAALWKAYEAAAPLDDGWERRRPALQLYHLLVHVGLFGAGYVRGVVARLDSLDW